MRTVLLTTVGLLALTGVTAQAAEVPRGYVGAAYGAANIDAGPIGDLDADFWNVQGLVSVPFAPGVSGEFSVEATQFDGDQTVWSPTGRLFFDVGQSRLGGFIGGVASEDVDFAGGGVEGRFAIAPDWRVDAAVGYGSGDIDGWAARGELRVFAGDNTRLDGFVDLVGFDTELGDFDGWTAGVGGEHQFTGAPVSVFARYEHSEADDLDLSSDAFRIGIRWNFGGGDLRDRYMDGQSSPTFADMFGGDLLRAASSLEEPEEDDDEDDGGGGGDDCVNCGFPDNLGGK